jgi:hypothetical protein
MALPPSARGITRAARYPCSNRNVTPYRGSYRRWPRAATLRGLQRASVPSRQACLDGVEDADTYFLLLGQHYADPLPDSGKSPTEEEFTVAKRRGIPIRVFRKRRDGRARPGRVRKPNRGAFDRRVPQGILGWRSTATTLELIAIRGRAVRS